MIADTGASIRLLLLGPVVVPALISLCGWVAGRLLGPAGRLATGNAVRNPRRTAATTASLLIGVTLTTAVLTGLVPYDQLNVSEAVVGDAKDYMLDNQDAMLALHEGVPLYIELPASVELLVEYTEPGLQGDRSSGGTKPARLETGKEIQVPLFIVNGEKIKVDTRDGSYLGRVSS